LVYVGLIAGSGTGLQGDEPRQSEGRGNYEFPLLTISPEAPVGEAMQLMVTKNVRRLYVIEGRRAIGRATQTAVFGNVFEAMESLLSVAY
jgi:signal-transduction protein with cAMP-binding, CBS, and nucleotidyltransferase domain